MKTVLALALALTLAACAASTGSAPNRATGISESQGSEAEAGAR
jgi:hypothetical protein